jgi:hypothetical protein
LPVSTVRLHASDTLDFADQILGIGRVDIVESRFIGEFPVVKNVRCLLCRLLTIARPEEQRLLRYVTIFGSVRGQPC